MKLPFISILPRKSGNGMLHNIPRTTLQLIENLSSLLANEESHQLLRHSQLFQPMYNWDRFPLSPIFYFPSRACWDFSILVVIKPIATVLTRLRNDQDRHSAWLLMNCGTSVLPHQDIAQWRYRDSGHALHALDRRMIRTSSMVSMKSWCP